MKTDLVELEFAFKALAYRKRLEILVFLMDSGWSTVSEIAEGLRAPLCTVSRNLAVLARTGLVRWRTRGNYVLYGIRKRGCSRTNGVLLGLVRWAGRPAEEKELADAVIADLLSGGYKHILIALEKRLKAR